MTAYSPGEHWIAFLIMPPFALANAGLSLLPAEIDTVLTMAILVVFIFGKPIGVLAFSALAVVLRLAIRPVELPWSLLGAGSVL
ncbi:Na+/H+ antiporter NhaA [Azospirillum doebereinerae]